MTSLRTAVAFREAWRPSTLPAHHRDHTSMSAHNHVGLLLVPMTVQRSSAGSSMISKSRNIRWLTRFAAVEARSSHRAMVWREGPVTRAVAARLTPALLRGSKTDPQRPLPTDPLTTDSVRRRPTKLSHLIEDVTCEDGLRLLPRPTARSKALPDDQLGYIRISQRAQIPYISIFCGLN